MTHRIGFLGTESQTKRILLISVLIGLLAGGVTTYLAIMLVHVDGILNFKEQPFFQERVFCASIDQESCSAFFEMYEYELSVAEAFSLDDQQIIPTELIYFDTLRNRIGEQMTFQFPNNGQGFWITVTWAEDNSSANVDMIFWISVLIVALPIPVTFALSVLILFAIYGRPVGGTPQGGHAEGQRTGRLTE